MNSSGLKISLMMATMANRKQSQKESGRTDVVFDRIAQGGKPTPKLLRWCAYYGDVSAIRHLLAHDAQLSWFGENLDLNGASFHGHWHLTQFLLKTVADPNYPLPGTGKAPLHAALCTADRLSRNLVMRVLLHHGANPNVTTKPAVETDGFMRDCRIKGELPFIAPPPSGTKRPSRC